jgi:hypothetical protein
MDAATFGQRGRTVGDEVVEARESYGARLQTHPTHETCGDVCQRHGGLAPVVKPLGSPSPSSAKK